MKEELNAEDALRLLELAHKVVEWTTQDILKPGAAGRQHLIEARQEYLRARVEAIAAIRPLMVRDTGGCRCGVHVLASQARKDCMYHFAAALQPWNHRIPWNCPTYYDGCNCEGGPLYERPTDTA